MTVGLQSGEFVGQIISTNEADTNAPVTGFVAGDLSNGSLLPA